MNKLITAKIYIETEIIINNIDNEKDLNKLALETFFYNKEEILNETHFCKEIRADNIYIIKHIEDINKPWDATCIPWTPRKDNSNLRIAEYLKQ